MGDLQAFLRQCNKHSQKREPKGLPIDQAIDFTEQIVRALQIIHDKQLMHRDLKPSNILVTTVTIDNGTGEARTALKLLIADFGLSRTVSCPPRTMTKQI
jgi:serine/threonine-protein kinase